MKTVNLNINGCLPQVRDGKDGKDGVNGKSAYDLWLANGNTGSEADFLESLKGPKGADGINGTNGDKGDKGDSLFEDAKLEEGKLIITKPDGSKLEVLVPTCPDTLLVDAFGKVEVGYIHSTTCDKSEVEPEPTTEKPINNFNQIILKAILASDKEGTLINNVNPSYVVFKLSDFEAPDTAIDSPLTAKLVIRNVAQNSQRVVSEDVYMTTIPTGKTYGSVPYISHSYTELVGKAADDDILIHTIYELTVENYSGKHVVTTVDIAINFQPIDRL